MYMSDEKNILGYVQKTCFSKWSLNSLGNGLSAGQQWLTVNGIWTVGPSTHEIQKISGSVLLIINFSFNVIESWYQELSNIYHYFRVYSRKKTFSFKLMNKKEEDYAAGSEFGLLQYRQELRSCALSPSFQYQCIEKVSLSHQNCRSKRSQIRVCRRNFGSWCTKKNLGPTPCPINTSA